MYKRILVPLDGTAASERIVAHAIAVAKCFNSTLVLLHAINARVQVMQATVSPEPLAAAPISTEIADQAVQAESLSSDAYLRGIKAQAAAEGVACEAAIVEGFASDTVLHAVEEYEIDLVAMTTQGRSTLGRLFFGSTAASILEQLTIPMLVLHAEEKKG